MTTDPSIIKELLQLFKLLQKNNTLGFRPKPVFEKLLISQFNMLAQFEKLIENEIQKARAGQKALIRIKINNLEEAHLIELLYKASEAGVTVQLIVRSICCLVPGIKGISSNITVKRLVDRYLEHTRFFVFGADHDAEVIMGSADWMNRNIHHRIEVCVPITSNYCKKELIDYFNFQWLDTAKTREILGSGEMQVTGNEMDSSVNAQQSIYQYLQQKAQYV